MQCNFCYSHELNALSQWQASPTWFFWHLDTLQIVSLSWHGQFSLRLCFKRQQRRPLSCSLTEFQATCGRGCHFSPKVCPSELRALSLNSLMQARLLLHWEKNRSHDYKQLTSWFETSFNMVYWMCSCISASSYIVSVIYTPYVCVRVFRFSISHNNTLKKTSTSVGPHEEWIGTQYKH